MIIGPCDALYSRTPLPPQPRRPPPPPGPRNPRPRPPSPCVRPTMSISIYFVYLHVVRFLSFQRGMSFLSTSAKTGDNVEEAFVTLARSILQAGHGKPSAQGATSHRLHVSSSCFFPFFVCNYSSTSSTSCDFFVYMICPSISMGVCVVVHACVGSMMRTTQYLFPTSPSPSLPLSLSLPPPPSGHQPQTMLAPTLPYLSPSGQASSSRVAGLLLTV